MPFVFVSAFDLICDLNLIQHWPDGTKPLPEPVLTYHQIHMFCGTHLGTILQEMFKVAPRYKFENC